MCRSYRYQGLGLQHTFIVFARDIIQPITHSMVVSVYSLTVPNPQFIAWHLPWAASQQSVTSGHLLVNGFLEHIPCEWLFSEVLTIRYLPIDGFLWNSKSILTVNPAVHCLSGDFNI